MIRKGSLVIVFAIALAPGVVNAGWAHEAVLTKDSPKLIYAQGEASRSIPVDGVRLLFRFPIERGSFEEAGHSGQSVVETIRKQLASLEGAKISIVHGWDLLKQALISWGTKGKRIDHNFAVELEEIASGKLHELVAQVIDRSLQTNDKLELERIEVYLTDSTEQKAQAALYQEAAQVALANAQGIAGATGAQLVGPRYLFATSGVESQTAPRDSDYLSEAIEKKMYRSIEVRKSFKVRGDVSDHLDLSVNVVGVFEIQ